jgi:hypothetical protein
VSSCGTIVSSGTVVMVRGVGVPSGGGVVVIGTVGVTILHPLEMGKSELPPSARGCHPLSVDSSRILCSDETRCEPFHKHDA